MLYDSLHYISRHCGKLPLIVYKTAEMGNLCNIRVSTFSDVVGDRDRRLLVVGTAENLSGSTKSFSSWAKPTQSDK